MAGGSVTPNISHDSAGIALRFHAELVRTEEPLYGSSGALQILQLTYISLAFIIVTLGNLLLLLLILRNRRLHRLSYVLLALLAMDGIWESLATLPAALVVMATRTPIQSDIWCQTQGVLHNSGTLFNIFILTMMSIENWVFICHPFKHRHVINKRNIIACVACTLTMSVILSLLPPLLPMFQAQDSELDSNESGDQYMFHPGLLMCSLYAEFSLDVDNGVSLCCLILSLIGGLTILFTQTQIYVTARRHCSAMRRYQTSSTTRNNVNKNYAKLRLVKVISLVLCIYFTTWILYAMVVTIEKNGHASDASVLVLMRIVALVVLTVPSSCNALLHAWRNRELRPFLKAALRCGLRPSPASLRRGSSTAYSANCIESASGTLIQNTEDMSDKHLAESSPTSETEGIQVSPVSTVTTELGDSPDRMNQVVESPQTDVGSLYVDNNNFVEISKL